MTGQHADGGQQRRGFGVAAGLDPAVAAPLAARCEELGYSSIWSNDHPAASGLETGAAFAEGTASLELGVAVMALDRHRPAEINATIERLEGAKDQAAEGRAICAELIAGLREIQGVAGAHVMAPAQGPDAIAQVLSSL